MHAFTCTACSTHTHTPNQQQGGCGACTVMVSVWDASAHKPRHMAVNACLAPLASMDGCAVTTVEGIGSIRAGVHPLQRRIAELHGSQCGFCTPGIVMAMYTLFRQHPDAAAEFIEENMDGNLCRCTGYRPLLDAAKTLVRGAGGGCCKGEKESIGTCDGESLLTPFPFSSICSHRRERRRRLPLQRPGVRGRGHGGLRRLCHDRGPVGGQGALPSAGRRDDRADLPPRAGAGQAPRAAPAVGQGQSACFST